MVIDRLTGEVIQESREMMMCGESREEREEKLMSWRKGWRQHLPSSHHLCETRENLQIYFIVL